jgi:hypothetical protein
LAARGVRAAAEAADHRVFGCKHILELEPMTTAFVQRLRELGCPHEAGHPMNETTDHADLLLYGAPAIARFLGLTERRRIQPGGAPCIGSAVAGRDPVHTGMPLKRLPPRLKRDCGLAQLLPRTTVIGKGPRRRRASDEEVGVVGLRRQPEWLPVRFAP